MISPKRFNFFYKPVVMRTLVSILFVPVIVGVVHPDFLRGLPLFLFVLTLSVLASREMFGMLDRIYHLRGPAAVVWVILPCSAVVVIYYLHLMVMIDTRAFLYAAVIFILVLLIRSIIIYGPVKGARHLMVMAASYVYTGIFPLTLLALKQQTKGDLLIYFLLLAAWMNDASAYLIGSAFGRTKGIIKYSPNKSVEGYIGSFIFTIGLCNVFRIMVQGIFPLSLLQTNIAGVMICILAPVGDIAESYIKRKAEVKDSSSLLPGMGGVLDVFDSILLCTPFFYLMIRLYRP